MKFDIYSLFAPFNLSPGTPVPQNREPRPTTEEPTLPAINYSLLAARPADRIQHSVRTGFTTAVGANA
jgi:hypothetical protein